MKVGIAGIGGIGSNVARLLAQAGIEQMIVVDFDSVEPGNLNRQFYTLSQVGQKKTKSLAANLNQINKEMQIEAVDRQIQPGDSATLFSGCDVVVEGFDSKHLKKMLIEELSESTVKIVSASGIAGTGMDTVGIRKMGNCCIVGDFTSDQDEHALFPPKVALVTAMMAAEVLGHCRK